MSIFPSILDGNNDQYEWKYSIGGKNDHYEWKKPQMEKMSIMNGKNNGWVLRGFSSYPLLLRNRFEQSGREANLWISE